MFQSQNDTIITLLKARDAARNYGKANYWFSYKDFLDPADIFTEFCCENLDGKQNYISLIEKLLDADKTAKIFVEVYGLEEDGNAQFIYADTLFIFSKLSLEMITLIFNELIDIFPSDIGEETDFSRQNYLIDENGNLVSVENLFDSGYSVYYCWWD